MNNQVLKTCKRSLFLFHILVHFLSILNKCRDYIGIQMRDWAQMKEVTDDPECAIYCTIQCKKTPVVISSP